MQQIDFNELRVNLWGNEQALVHAITRCDARLRKLDEEVAFLERLRSEVEARRSEISSQIEYLRKTNNQGMLLSLALSRSI